MALLSLPTIRESPTIDASVADLRLHSVRQSHRLDLILGNRLALSRCYDQRDPRIIAWRVLSPTRTMSLTRRFWTPVPRMPSILGAEAGRGPAFPDAPNARLARWEGTVHFLSHAEIRDAWLTFQIHRPRYYVVRAGESYPTGQGFSAFDIPLWGRTAFRPKGERRSPLQRSVATRTNIFVSRGVVDFIFGSGVL